MTGAHGDPQSRSEAEELRRLRWQCRRGLLELDVMLQRFLAIGYAELASADRAAFQRLLAQPDTRLLAWFNRASSPPRELMHIVKIVLQHFEH